MRDVLLDIVKHTNGLGIIEAVKIEGTDDGTYVEAMDPDRTVVLNGKLHSRVQEFQGTFGLSRLGVLQGYLNYGAYEEDTANIEVVRKERNGVEQPEEIRFSSPQGYQSSYRFMASDLLESQLRSVRFKGVEWDVEFQPSLQNIKDLTYFNSILGGFEPTFTVRTSNKSLKLYIGDGTSDRVEIPFVSNVDGTIGHAWNWKVAPVLSILKLADTGSCTMSISDKGAMQLAIDSGIGQYNYILPAQS